MEGIRAESLRPVATLQPAANLQGTRAPRQEIRQESSPENPSIQVSGRWYFAQRLPLRNASANSEDAFQCARGWLAYALSNIRKNSDFAAGHIPWRFALCSGPTCVSAGHRSALNDEAPLPRNPAHRRELLDRYRY